MSAYTDAVKVEHALRVADNPIERVLLESADIVTT